MWGYENTDIIEKVHTKFCKFIFGVSKFSHNMPIYGELGRYPLSITIKQRMICYWTRILKSNQHKLNKVMYDILYNLHCKDTHSSGWIKCINTIFQNNGMSYIWATQDFKVDSNNVHRCECDQFKQLWHSRITCDAIDSNNMMYKTFKYSHGKEKYTEILPEHFKKALLYSNSEWGRTNCQSITVNTLMYLELIDIVQIVTNLSWVMRFTFYMNVQS